jgi:hypothetical protein
VVMRGAIPEFCGSHLRRALLTPALSPRAK